MHRVTNCLLNSLTVHIQPSERLEMIHILIPYILTRIELQEAKTQRVPTFTKGRPPVEP